MRHHYGRNDGKLDEFLTRYHLERGSRKGLWEITITFDASCATCAALLRTVRALDIASHGRYPERLPRMSGLFLIAIISYCKPYFFEVHDLPISSPS
jgi:hypothetical protein